jgi:hypothetical protein
VEFVRAQRAVSICVQRMEEIFEHCIVHDVCISTTSRWSLTLGPVNGAVRGGDEAEEIPYLFLAEVAHRFSDIALRTRVSANGDYQDAGTPGSYLFASQEERTSSSRSCEFLRHLGPTCGYDFAEAYGAALRRISQYDRGPLAAKALVFIGDVLPHPPAYILNAENLDWKVAVRALFCKRSHVRDCESNGWATQVCAAFVVYLAAISQSLNMTSARI